MRELVPRPGRCGYAVRRETDERLVSRVAQRRREIDAEAEIRKAAEQQATVRTGDPLRIECPIHRPGLTAARAGRVDRVNLERAVAVGGKVDPVPGFALSAPPAPPAPSAAPESRRFVVPVAVGQIPNRPAGQVERKEVPGAVLSKRRAIRRKDDRVPVRADARIEVFVAIGGQPLETPRTQRITGICDPETVEVG